MVRSKLISKKPLAQYLYGERPVH